MYDPLVNKTVPEKQGKPNSFWAAKNIPSTLPLSALHGMQNADVVIIGAGYTGLSCALHLAKEFGVSCAIVEANEPGWGCSGRNGGFVLPGTGRLSIKQTNARWNENTSKAMYSEYLRSINTVNQFIDSGIHCERTSGGYLKLAHKPSLLPALHEQASLLSSEYGDTIIPLSSTQISEDYMAGARSFGGIYYPNAVGINPWLFCQGLARKAIDAGVTIYSNSSVLRCEKTPESHIVHTQNGHIKAQTLVLASNAYGQASLHPALNNKTFPVVSSIIVTQPLTPQQLSSIGMRDGLMVMDTRPLKYYYRLLPDKRLLFGGRGSVKGANADNKKYLLALKKGLLATFPSLSDVQVSNFWSGWVNVSYDDYPRIYHHKSDNLLYSSGYCGAGLAFSVQAGKRLSQLLMAPHELPDLPYWKTPLKTYPFASMRRCALSCFYAVEALKQAK